MKQEEPTARLDRANVSGTQPDSPREWQAVFVGDPDRNCVVGSTAEHFPPARIDGYRLKSANEATRVATYSPVGGDGVETGAGSAAPRPAGSSPSNDRNVSGNGGSGDLSAPVWRVGRSWGRTVVRQAGEHPSKTDDELLGMMLTPELAQQVCDAVNARRVSVDDDTVERVARALYVCDDPRRIPGDAEAEWDDPDREDIRDAWRPLARAAVQALRDGPQDERCQGCGGLISEGGHGMSEYGGCV